MRINEAMTVRQLIRELERVAGNTPDAKVCIFAEGNNYPALQVQKLDEKLAGSEPGQNNLTGYIEIGGGWEEI